MKNIFTAVLILFSFSGFAQTVNETTATIDQVTVFSNQGQVSSSLSANLPEGTSKLVIKELASTIDVNSIKVGGRGAFTLLSVNFENDFISQKQVAWQDSLNVLSLAAEDIAMLLEVNAQEREMIMDNTKIKADTDDLYKEDLEELSVYFRKKLTTLGKEKLKLKRDSQANAKKKARIQQQMKEDPSRRLPLGKIILTVKADNATRANIKLNYLVHGTGWKPTYDIRVANTDSPVNLSYKAEVHQNTGVDWTNVKLILSTASVNKRTVKPELNPHYLHFYNNRPPVMAKSRTAGLMIADAQAPMAMKVAEEEMSTASNYAEVLETSLNKAFNITLPYTIKTGKKEIVEVQNLSMNAKYITYVVPKRDENGFLVAEIMDWEQYNLIPAQANVYFEDTFIGKSYIRNAGVSDKLKISLGRDERIQVKREVIEDFKSRRTLGSNIKETFGYTISAKNSKNERVNIVVEDQIPVSQDSDIEVEIEELSNGSLDTKTGKLKWELAIPPAQSRMLELKYEIKYPKDKPVVNL